MKNIFSFFALLLFVSVGSCARQQTNADGFIRISGVDLLKPDGSKLFIRGTNLGNWLNPEGYMFGFGKTNSPERINRMFCELVGPDFTADFWRRFKDNYITREDMAFIASTGANTVRVPFHYKLFTDEDYMGLTAGQDGFARIDSVVKWCRDNNLYIILDMHDAPGGQTGDNIDDSYGYPWLFESEASQLLFCEIWTKIAAYYRDETVILGYDLINEPIAPYFENVEALNGLLEPLYRRVVKAIREVDRNHIVLIGGAQWNSNFKPLRDASFDDKMMYTCHRYGGEPTAAAIRSFIAFRDSVGKPMYMGEIGHNSDEWQAAFCRTMEENNIGYTFWPYKKKDSSSFVGIVTAENWRPIIDFAEANRSFYKDIREARPDQQAARKAMDDFIEACKFRNCTVQDGYIGSLGLKHAQ
ncbi:MAG: glycoside hydrolase family 5 protein [Tannerella sp.]|jgi:aryl-phospho-beta-D-glucosidase BglC (GH1 family)|nr:glycoside hydrolase family 5 protein [Tannerella sp.]